MKKKTFKMYEKHITFLTKKIEKKRKDSRIHIYKLKQTKICKIKFYLI